VTLVQRV
jgi:hypothetical protein